MFGVNNPVLYTKDISAYVTILFVKRFRFVQSLSLFGLSFRREDTLFVFSVFYLDTPITVGEVKWTEVFVFGG